MQDATMSKHLNRIWNKALNRIDPQHRYVNTDLASKGIDNVVDAKRNLLIIRDMDKQSVTFQDYKA